MAASRPEDEQKEKQRRDNEEDRIRKLAYRAALWEEHGGRLTLDRIDENTEEEIKQRGVQFTLGLPPDTHKPMKSGVYKWSNSLDDDEKFYYDAEKNKMTWGPSHRGGNTTPEKLATMIYKMSLAAAYEDKIPCYVHLENQNIASATAMLQAFERNASDKTPIDMRLSSEDFDKLQYMFGNKPGVNMGLTGFLEGPRLKQMYGTDNVVEALRIAQQRSIERFASFNGYNPEDYSSKKRAQEYIASTKKINTENKATYSEDLRSGDMNKLFSGIPVGADGNKDPNARMDKIHEVTKMIAARIAELSGSITTLENEIAKREKVVSDIETRGKEPTGFGAGDHETAFGFKRANENELDARLDLLQAMKDELKELQRLRDEVRKEVSDPAKGYDKTAADDVKNDLDNWDKTHPGDDASVDKRVTKIKQDYLKVEVKVNDLLKQMEQQPAQQQQQSSSPKPV